HRACGRHHIVHSPADRLGAGDDEDGPEPLAPGEDAVAHGLVKRLGTLRPRGQHALEGGIHRGCPHLHVVADIERHWSTSSTTRGSVLRLPLSSRVRNSMRFSASSRYAAQRRAKPTPSSKILSESSSARLPASS